MLLVFALAGWIAVIVMMARDDSWTLLRAAATRFPLQGALAATLGGLAWAPLLSWGRLSAWAGAPVGLLAGLTGLYLYFFAWPHDWQAGRLNAWKSVALFLEVYGWLLGPLAALAGGVAAGWARRPIRPPRWAREEETSKPVVQPLPTTPVEALPAASPSPAPMEPDPELEQATELIDPETLRALESYRKGPR